MRHIAIVAIGIPLLVSACASSHQASPPDTQHSPSAPSYKQSIYNRPLPADEAARHQECAMLMSEISRQQGYLNYVMSSSHGKALPVIKETYLTIEALHERTIKIGCNNTTTLPNKPE